MYFFSPSFSSLVPFHIRLFFSVHCIYFFGIIHSPLFLYLAYPHIHPLKSISLMGCVSSMSAVRWKILGPTYSISYLSLLFSSNPSFPWPSWIKMTKQNPHKNKQTNNNNKKKTLLFLFLRKSLFILSEALMPTCLSVTQLFSVGYLFELFYYLKTYFHVVSFSYVNTSIIWMWQQAPNVHPSSRFFFLALGLYVSMSIWRSLHKCFTDT